jgi:hypothetical protein
MTDQEKLNNARILFDRGEYIGSRKQLESISTDNPNIRLNVLLTFLGVLDHVTENEKLLEVVEEGISLADTLGNDSVKIYLLSKKCSFLLSDLSMMSYTQVNLKLASRAFEWIDFSLEIDKQEYKQIEVDKKKLKTEIDESVELILSASEKSTNHMLLGHLFSTVGDIYNQWYLIDKLIYQEGGKLKSKVANLYFVRRWNLEKYLYPREGRRKTDSSKKLCIFYFRKSVKEFGLAGKKSELAYAIYNFSVKYTLFNEFRKAKKLLRESKVIAEANQDKRLLDKISDLETKIADKNRTIKDYVGEMGLDLPRGVRSRG